MVEQSDWQARWDEGRIGFHTGAVHPALRAFGARLVAGRGRVLVPLCGKALDLAHLAAAGHEVIGVEFVERAAQAFFAEQALTASRRDEGHPVYEGGNISIHVADFFALQAEALGPIDAVFDRAALVAIDPDRRRAYAERLLALLPAGGRLLLVTLSYDPALMDGPPFSVEDAEVERLFGAGAEVERLEASANASTPSRLAEQGGALTEVVWLVTKGASSR